MVKHVLARLGFSFLYSIRKFFFFFILPPSLLLKMFPITNFKQHGTERLSDVKHHLSARGHC